MRARKNPIGESVAADADQRTRSSANYGFGGRPPKDALVVTDVRVIRVGPNGVHTHIYDPSLSAIIGGERRRVGGPMCGSGFRSANGSTRDVRVPQLYDSDAEFVTCTRCQKLSGMNQSLTGSFLRE